MFSREGEGGVGGERQGERWGKVVKSYHVLVWFSIYARLLIR